MKYIQLYPVVTFTVLFLFLFRFGSFLVLYFFDKERFSEYFGLSLFPALAIATATYFVQWIIVVLLFSKYSKERIKTRLLEHPYITSFLTSLYLWGLLQRLVWTEVGGGILGAINAFETIVYYAVVSFIWWILFTWISKKIWKKRESDISWYRKSVEFLLAYLSPVYKVILGAVVVYFLFSIIPSMLALMFGYSGSDLQKLGL